VDGGNLGCYLLSETRLSEGAPAEKDRLLKKYWSIPDRQVETPVVLADAEWFDAAAR
jgi:hypothetical protein